MSTVKRGKAGRFVNVQQDRIDRLRKAGFSLGFARREDVNPNTPYLACRHVEFEYYQGHKIRTVTAGGDEAYGLPFVDLGRVARDDEGYEQCTLVDRSNFRSLLKINESMEGNGERPAFTTIGYGRTDCLGAFVADLTDDLIDTLIGLSEQYPIYDESDWSELELDEQHASWDAYLRSDLYNEMGRIHKYNGAMQVIWDRLGEDVVRQLFWDAVSESAFGGCIPDHDGKDVLWGDQDNMVRIFRTVLIKAYWDRRKGCSQCGSDSDECMQGCRYQDGERVTNG